MERCKNKNCHKPAFARQRCKEHYFKTPMATKTAARQYVDYDYVDRLSDEELAWLSKFTNEYYHNTFGKVEALHKTPAERQPLYEADNNRRRAAVLTFTPQPEFNIQQGPISPEDALIEAFDKKHGKK